jgi:dUTP pyrophosphatase
MSKFEVVKRLCDGDKVDANLPTRATQNSAGYDFEVCEDIVIPSYWNIMEILDDYMAKKFTYTMDDIKRVTKMTNLKPTLVPTGIKCKLDPDEYLEISVRSSTPLNAWIILANGIGIIDSDYYENPDNDGEIFFQVINFSPVDIVLRPGDKIGQGIIKKYGRAENDISGGERTGGFGSTSV